MGNGAVIDLTFSDVTDAPGKEDFDNFRMGDAMVFKQTGGINRQLVLGRPTG
ncbi:MAG: hypothetical protein ACPGOV_12750 [Magnetovibrionaceae bacterium]